MALQRDLDDLRQRIAADDYAVDPRVVADAMLRRQAGRPATGPGSPMLVAAELDWLFPRAEQDEPSPRQDPS